MIGYLKGKVTKFHEWSYILVDVNGVGYKVYVDKGEYDSLKDGQEISYFIQTIVKENAIDLYGFNSSLCLELFNKFLSVQGVGAKSALSILSVMTNASILEAIASKNAKKFESVSGIGKKTSENIIATLSK